MDPFEVYHQLLNKDILFYEGWKSIYTGTYQYYGLKEPDMRLYHLGRIIGLAQPVYNIYFIVLFTLLKN